MSQEPELSFYWYGQLPHDDALISRLMSIPNTLCEVLDILEEGNEHYEVYLEFCYPSPVPSSIGYWEAMDTVNK